MNTAAPKPLVVIVGETASGKSSLATRLAEQFNGEIINADSWQIYQEMDIGTAKPSKKDMQKIPHHLVDLISPKEDFTAAVYKNLAEDKIDKITRNGKLPIMVGGTGLYINGVLFDYSFAPEGDPSYRRVLNKKTISELLQMLKDQNISLAGIDTRNKRRLIRLLETGGAQPEQSGLRPGTLVVGLGVPKSKLRKNIEKRTESMFKAGLKYEVSNLAEKYGWDVEAMKGIGYKEFKPYFMGEQSLSETKRKIIKSTLDLAKKQRTWFKRNQNIVWVNDFTGANKLIQNFLSEFDTM